MPLTRQHARQAVLGARSQRGLSLVELMVGIAVGLFVVAGAVMVVTTQLGDNRRLLLDAQLQQDLRATLDIVTREVRRAGGVADATALAGFWQEGSATVAENNLAPIALNEGGSEIVFRYRRAGDEGPYGFKLDGTTIRSLLGDGWQELTDGNIMSITEFKVTAVAEDPPAPPVQIPCPRLCADGTSDCWPTLAVRSYTVDIGAQSRIDPAVQRSVRSVVRVRNDVVQFDDSLPPNQACPA
ncbi:MAG: prepilin-type N-terminal cleavage/methylation domain-containing protein [Betaproteobacteria bacterium]|nr:prepilin-type N-terminal cleavage/methylation domain-containing protein [Betaproteobacteria bacterium]